MKSSKTFNYGVQDNSTHRSDVVLRTSLSPSNSLSNFITADDVFNELKTADSTSSDKSRTLGYSDISETSMISPIASINSTAEYQVVEGKPTRPVKGTPENTMNSAVLSINSTTVDMITERFMDRTADSQNQYTKLGDGLVNTAFPQNPNSTYDGSQKLTNTAKGSSTNQGDVSVTALMTVVLSNNSTIRDDSISIATGNNAASDTLTIADGPSNTNIISSRGFTTDSTVPQVDGCYLQDFGVLQENQTVVNSICTIRWHCTNNLLTTDESFRCDSNAVCEVRTGLRQCYCFEGFSGDGQTCSPVECLSYFNAGYVASGVYSVKPTGWSGTAFEVFCNMDDGGGWTVFQRRYDGSVDFNQYWENYKHGFGSINGEFWLGNEKLYYLTNQRNYTLRVDMTSKFGNTYYVEYSLFRISDEGAKYPVTELGNAYGTAGADAMRSMLNMKFSTRDQDNDGWSGITCSEAHKGGWWYGCPGSCSPFVLRLYDILYQSSGCAYCTDSNLNGDNGSTVNGQNIFWAFQDSSGYCGMISTEMRIRPV
ncbi:hypothetical protein BSL78_11777 [Apostichopus japonicus]|uniref:Fibrinogen C-terminal domain-containing protein n=1 Tax=Stichopus japonicus TaxID=307972 RepID=A0A2G8KTS7_STIJA|nr:hypothetical protein BSL78_11777 [Apostichopus japonicus]